jgi:hypothetical protein
MMAPVQVTLEIGELVIKYALKCATKKAPFPKERGEDGGAVKIQSVIAAVLLAALLATSAQAQGRRYRCPGVSWDPHCQMLPPQGYPLPPLPSNRLSDEPPEPRFTVPIDRPPVPNRSMSEPPAAQLTAPIGPVTPPNRMMDMERERIIQLGEEHCRRWPEDKICHFKDAPR